MSNAEQHFLTPPAAQSGPPGAIRRAAQAEAERLRKLVQAAGPLLAPLRGVVAELREAEIDADLRVERPRHGDITVKALLRCPRIHETRDDGLPPWPKELPVACSYEVHVDPIGGTIQVEGPVEESAPGPDDRYVDPFGPVWCANYGKGRGCIDELAETMRSLAVGREVEAILQGSPVP